MWIRLMYMVLKLFSITLLCLSGSACFLEAVECRFLAGSVFMSYHCDTGSAEVHSRVWEVCTEHCEGPRHRGESLHFKLLLHFALIVLRANIGVSDQCHRATLWSVLVPEHNQERVVVMAAVYGDFGALLCYYGFRLFKCNSLCQTWRDKHA